MEGFLVKTRLGKRIWQHHTSCPVTMSSTREANPWRIESYRKNDAFVGRSPDLIDYPVEPGELARADAGRNPISQLDIVSYQAS